MKQLPWADELKAREARHKALLYLRDEGGYSFRQIGRALNISKVEAECRYHKARRQKCFYCENLKRGVSMKHRGESGSELCEDCYGGRCEGKREDGKTSQVPFSPPPVFSSSPFPPNRAEKK
jgi:hypothetical protein